MDRIQLAKDLTSCSVMGKVRAGKSVVSIYNRNG
jgi:hypothetical protein